MKLEVKYSKEIDAGRFAHTTNSILYRLKDARSIFYVIPELKNSYKSLVHLCVIHPDLEISYNPSFWRFIRNAQLSVPSHKLLPQKIILNIIENLKKYRKISKKEAQNFKKEWKGVQMKFFKFIKGTLIDKYIEPQQITIHLSRFGNLGSYTNTMRNGNFFLNLYSRIDLPSDYVAQTIISAYIDLLYTYRQTRSIDPRFKSELWLFKQRLTDFLMTETKLSKLFPRYKPMLNFMSSEGNAELSAEAGQYLRKLGIDQGEIFKIVNSQIYYIQNKRFISNLTSDESKLFKLMIKHKQSICTYDQIAERIWGEDQYKKYSPNYLTKLVHSLRSKLALHNINPNIIQTKRGEGYLLLN